MITINSSTLQIGLDEETGFLSQIIVKEDESKMNWVLDRSDWGKVDGYRYYVRSASDRLSILEGTHKEMPIRLQIIRHIIDGVFEERYVFYNPTKDDYHCLPEQFGIHFPFQCSMERGDIACQWETKCTAHVWCGGNTCWLYGAKISGHGPHLMIYLTEGSVSNYSISRNPTRTKSASDYRGDIVLNPDSFVIPPKGFHVLAFRYEGTHKGPKEYLEHDTDMLQLYASRYSLFENEKTTIIVTCKRGLSDLNVSINGIPFSVLPGTNGKVAYGEWSAGSPGEYRVRASASGKETFAFLQVLRPLESILKRRAGFIAEKQQVHDTTSPLDGAYLIYDDDTLSIHMDDKADHNAARERVVMGIIVALQLQQEFDEKLYSSLKQYAAFLEREIYDASTNTVYDGVGREPVIRHYNDPWLSIFFRELFLVTREKKYLQYAGDILIRYYLDFGLENTGNCEEPYETASLLEENGELKRAEKMRNLAKQAIQNKYENGGYPKRFFETGYQHEYANYMAEKMFEYSRLYRDPSYAKIGEQFLLSAQSFYSFQPDYRMNRISVRHWDCYWFGKRHIFGDLFPHYWSAMAASMWYSYSLAAGRDCRETIRQILMGNLCLFRDDGFAANSYLAPFMIDFYVPDGVKPVKYLESFGKHFGKTYDKWANDQDWALWFAWKMRSVLQPSSP